MKMLMIVFRSSLRERVEALLHTSEVYAYTVIPETRGLGETGPAEGSSIWPGVNSVVMVALTDDQAERVSKAVNAYVEQTGRRKERAKPPIRVFAWPCAQMV
jgi:hypothetical protein